MLADIQNILVERGLVSDTWASEMTLRGQLVKLFRDYYDGNHRAKLTNEMRKMLRVTNDHLDRFNVNYCPLVVDALADRLTVDTIEAMTKAAKKKKPSPPSPLPNAALGEGSNSSAPADSKNAVSTDAPDSMAQKETYQASIPTPDPSPLHGERKLNPMDEWVSSVLECNRFDALQIDVREAVLRDGDTFVMVQYDDAEQMPKFAHELAWDGTEGVLVVYDRMGKNIAAGVKIWKETNATRVNIYFPGEVLKFTAPKEGGGLGTEVKGKDADSLGEPDRVPTVRGADVPGVPIIHFKNKGTKTAGQSELINIIPLQDGLNRTFVSMVMTAELSAFQVRTAKGFVPPSDLAPGSWIQFGVDEDADMLSAMEAGVMEQAQLVPFISEADFIIHQIGTVTHTPLPASSDTQSGEALKERQIGLLAKANRAKVQQGNAWENVLAMAHSFTRIFGGQKLPDVEKWTTRWKDSQIRNDAEILAIAEWYMKHGFEREALRIMSQSSLVEYDESDIDDLIAQKAKDGAAKMAMFRLPGMGRFNGMDDAPPPPQRNTGNTDTGQQPEREAGGNRPEPMVSNGR